MTKQPVPGAARMKTMALGARPWPLVIPPEHDRQLAMTYPLTLDPHSNSSTWMIFGTLRIATSPCSCFQGTPLLSGGFTEQGPLRPPSLLWVGVSKRPLLPPEYALQIPILGLDLSQVLMISEEPEGIEHSSNFQEAFLLKGITELFCNSLETGKERPLTFFRVLLADFVAPRQSQLRPCDFSQRQLSTQLDPNGQSAGVFALCAWHFMCSTSNSQNSPIGKMVL